jgi:hypothetical protein
MKIKVPDIQNSLKGKLQEAVSQIESIGEEVEEKWMKIKTLLNDICENTIGYPDKKDKIWILDNTWDNIYKRKQVKIKMSGMYNTQKQKKVGKRICIPGEGSKEINVERSKKVYGQHCK